jgi:hypothetical protein
MDPGMKALETLATEAGFTLQQYELKKEPIMIGHSDWHSKKPRNFYITSNGPLDLEMSKKRGTCQDVRLHTRDGYTRINAEGKSYTICDYDYFRKEVKKSLGVVPFDKYQALLQLLRKQGAMTMVIGREEVQE